MALERMAHEQSGFVLNSIFSWSKLQLLSSVSAENCVLSEHTLVVKYSISKESTTF